MVTIPLCQNLQLSPQVCAKLKSLGVILPPSTSISNNLLFRQPITFGGGCHLSRVKIDAFSYAWNNTTIRNTSIGRYCSIAHNVEIGLKQQDFSCLSTSQTFTSNSYFQSYTGRINRLDPFAREHGDDSAHITIGHDVWIGTRVCITNGVTIGHGAVIGTGSFICNDVPPYAIVAGRDGGENSQGIIKRYRYSDEVISDLLELKWWDFDLPKLMHSVQDQPTVFPFNEVKNFISFMRDSDTSTWPQLPKQWLYLAPRDANNVQIYPVSEDFDMGHRYPKPKES